MDPHNVSVRISVKCKLSSLITVGSSDSYDGTDWQSADNRSSRGGVIVIYSCVRHWSLEVHVPPKDPVYE